MIVAGIGRRGGLPHPTRSYIEAVGSAFAERGHICISGGAEGTDSLFILGAQMASAETWIYLPGMDTDPKALKKYEEPRCTLRYASRHKTDADSVLAQQACYSPDYWSTCSSYALRLMIRDAMIAKACHVAVAFPDTNRAGWGGTGHTLRCMMLLGKPTLAFISDCWFPVILNQRGEIDLERPTDMGISSY